MEQANPIQQSQQTIYTRIIKLINAIDERTAAAAAATSTANSKELETAKAENITKEIFYLGKTLNLF